MLIFILFFHFCQYFEVVGDDMHPKVDLTFIGDKFFKNCPRFSPNMNKKL
jgi:hypothetical protein